MARTKNTRGAKGGGTIRKKTVTRNGQQYEYWEARVTVGRDPGSGKQVQRSFTGKTQAEVRKKMQQAAVEIDTGDYRDPSKMTVGQWLGIWSSEYLGGIKPNTRVKYKRSIELYMIPAMDAIRLDELNPHTIQRFYNDLADHGGRAAKRDENGKLIRKDGKTVYGQAPLASKTIKDIHGILHAGLQQAVRNGYIRANPSESCNLPKYVKKELTPLDEDQAKAFLAAIKGHRLEILFTTALFTGMREGELLGLKWDCVDFDHGKILVDKQYIVNREHGNAYELTTTKSGKTRKISVAPWVMQLLRQHKAQQSAQRLQAGALWENSGLVFTDELGRHLCFPSVFHQFRAVATSIGRPDARFHDLRHTYAVNALRAGDDPKTVQENLGHYTAAFTLDVYGHVTDQMRQASANRMEDFIKNVLNL